MQNSDQNKNSITAGAFKLFAIVFLIPIAILAFIEFSFRVFFPGPPSRLYIEETVAEQGKVLRTNFQAVERFFPGKLARKPLADIFPAKKTDGNLRIFILGESAARGERLSDFSFSRMLEAYLNKGLTHRKAEVINTGIPAINSWILKEFAVELADYEPDLFVIYAGHNEFIGPYGPASFNGRKRSRQSIKLGIWASSLRLIRVILGENLPPGMAKGWRGLEMFINNKVVSGSEDYLSCRSNWEKNLEEILSLAKSAGIPVIYCKVPVNLKDCPPFASNEEGLTEQQKQAITELAAKNSRNESSNMIEELEKLKQNTPDHALLAFLLGRQFLAAGQHEKALSFFKEARKNDCFPVRIPESFNESGEKTAKKFGATVVDLVKEFAENSNDGICGEDLIYDHVHLTEKGHFLVARSLAEAVRNSNISGKSLFSKPFPDFADMLELTGFSDYDREQNLHSIIGSFERPPFTLQFLAEKRLDYFKNELKVLQGRYQLSDCLERIEKYQQNYPWCFAGFNRAAMMLMPHEPTLAVEYFARSLKLNPFNPDAHNNRGMLLMQTGEKEQALSHLSSAVKLSPNHAMAHYNLGILSSMREETASALHHYQTAVKIDPGMVSAWRNLANIHFRSGKFEDALAVYKAAEIYNTEDIYIKIGQSNCLLELAQNSDAFALLTQLVASYPESPLAHFSMGIAYEKTKKFAQASHHFERSGNLGHLPGIQKALQLDLSGKQKLTKESFLAIAEEGCRQTDFSDPWLIQVYASALLNMGKAQEALAVLHRAEKLAINRGESSLAQEIRANINLISQN